MDTNINAWITGGIHEGCALLHVAARKGHADCLKLLLEQKGIEVNCPNSEGMTPLHSAAQNGHCECIKLLLAHKDININAQITGTLYHNCTALILAATKGYTECVKLLLSHKNIDLSLVYHHGYQPIHLAAQAGLVDMLKDILKDATIDINTMVTYWPWQ